MNYRILIVDDNEMMREFLTSYLNEKYLVNAVEGGFEAIAYLHSETIPDLIIVDLNMPHIDGYSLLEKTIKGNDQFAHIPVIILSGSKQSECRIRCLESGAADFVIKPFNPKELELRISHTLKEIQ